MYTSVNILNARQSSFSTKLGINIVAAIDTPVLIIKGSIRKQSLRITGKMMHTKFKGPYMCTMPKTIYKCEHACKEIH